MLNEEVHNMYTFQNISGVKSRRRRWVGHVACTGEIRNDF
jgi:hypothetical protein